MVWALRYLISVWPHWPWVIWNLKSTPKDCWYFLWNISSLLCAFTFLFYPFREVTESIQVTQRNLLSRDWRTLHLVDLNRVQKKNVKIIIRIRLPLLELLTHTHLRKHEFINSFEKIQMPSCAPSIHTVTLAVRRLLMMKNICCAQDSRKENNKKRKKRRRNISCWKKYTLAGII